MQHGDTSHQAIFENASQAIHVAFTIMGEDAPQDSTLRKSLIRILESMDLPQGKQRSWLEQLRGTPSETVHFGGLSPSDVRAQCALITLSVESKLPGPERWAIQAKYGKTDFEDIEGKRRFAFSAERIEAIRQLAGWLSPSFAELPRAALDCMVAKFYAKHKKTTISFRDLAKSFGHNRMTYARAFEKLKVHLRALENMAVMRLTPYFEEQGLVEISQETA
jgi:hypothetical protein